MKIDLSYKILLVFSKKDKKSVFEIYLFYKKSGSIPLQSIGRKKYVDLTNFSFFLI